MLPFFQVSVHIPVTLQVFISSRPCSSSCPLTDDWAVFVVPYEALSSGLPQLPIGQTDAQRASVELVWAPALESRVKIASEEQMVLEVTLIGLKAGRQTVYAGALSLASNHLVFHRNPLQLLFE